MIHVDVIPAVGFSKVLVGAAEIPLAAPRAGVVPWSGDSEHSPQSQNPAANVLPVEVTAEADLFYLEFVGPENLGRAPERVILGMVETANEVSVKSDFQGKEF